MTTSAACGATSQDSATASREAHLVERLGFDWFDASDGTMTMMTTHNIASRVAEQAEKVRT